jgi:uncharacterized membrane protein YcaP (DUF421 family)
MEMAGTWLGTTLPRVGFIVLSTLLIYGSTLVGIRLGDRRALTQLNPFDFVVAVALGSLVARTATSPQPSYLEGLTGLVTLLVSHLVFSQVRRRYDGVRRIVDRPPLVLVRDGEVRTEALASADLTASDLARLLRENGVRRVEDVEVGILETRGVLSVLPHGDGRIDDWLNCPG